MKNRKFLLGLTAVTALAVIAGCTPQAGTNTNTEVNANTNAAVDTGTDSNIDTGSASGISESGSGAVSIIDAKMNATMDISANQMIDLSGSDDAVKEVTMTSFYEMVDGAPQPQFSVKQITVKKGDTVRIKVTNTRGNHDFNIDEFDVKAATPIDEEVVIEFTADQAGEFTYYCGMPNHRQLGHWGVLKVVE